MESDSTLSALVLGAFLGGFGLVALAQASVGWIGRDRAQRLVAQDVPGVAALNRLGDLPEGLTAALSLAKIACGVGALLSAFALAIAWGDAGWGAVVLASVAVLALLGVLHGVAERLSSVYGEFLASRVAPALPAINWALTPLTALKALSGREASGTRSDAADAAEVEMPSEIGLPLDSNGKSLDEHEVRMIRGVVRLDMTVAREIMVPRVDIEAAELDTTVSELAERMVEGGHSRIPLYREDLDHIEGIAHARDVLRHLTQADQASSASVQRVMRPALFIPESKTLEELLSEFQQRRVQLAVVVDEYGGVSGLVTIEDLLEEIVGEIQDEFDAGEPEIENVGEREFLIDARVGIDELNELLNVSVEGDGFDTLGGFVYHHLGKIPSTGDAVEYDDLRIEVVSTVGRRVKRLRVTHSGEHHNHTG